MALNDLTWGTGISAASDLLGGFGSLTSANAQAAGYKAAAGSATANAGLARTKTSLDLIRQQRATYKVLGGQRADIAHAGLATSGSALDLMRSSARDASLDASLIKLQGQMDVNDWVAKASAYSAQGSATKKSGIGGLLGGILSAASVLL